jgi:hypothetical protein
MTEEKLIKAFMVKGRNDDKIREVEVRYFGPKSVRLKNGTLTKSIRDYACYFRTWTDAWNYLHGSAMEDVEDANQTLFEREQKLQKIKLMQKPVAMIAEERKNKTVGAPTVTWTPQNSNL